MPCATIVIPCHNERAGLDSLVRELARLAATEARVTFEFVLVNDGSIDGTLDRLTAASRDDERFVVVDLSRNFGKEAAVSAGLFHARGDAVVVMDADLQHPPATISAFLTRWLEGWDVVLGKRSHRDHDGAIYRTFARGFYSLHNRLCDPEIPPDVGDFRLMDRAVVDAILSLPEQRRFMKGIFAWIGFRSCTVDFDMGPRVSGRSRYNFLRSVQLALEGITSFSIVPLRLLTIAGSVIALASLAYGIFVLVQVAVLGIDVPGYASLAVLVSFIGALQLIGTGIVGEYVGRTYIEAKRRPVFVVQGIYRNGVLVSRRDRRPVR
jgi:glycosyltransferase involved in cell wall biosynthesis